MAKKQVRDSSYYEERLQRDHPSVYTDLKAGKYKTVAEAATAVGLKRPRTRTHELKNAWSKASARSKMTSCVGTPAAIVRIKDIMAKRHLLMGDLMAEMGYRKLNPSVGNALSQGWKLRPDVIAALEKWLVANHRV